MNKAQKIIISLVLLLPPLIILYTLINFLEGRFLITEKLTHFPEIYTNVAMLYGISILMGTILFIVWRDKIIRVK